MTRKQYRPRADPETIALLVLSKGRNTTPQDLPR